MSSSVSSAARAISAEQIGAHALAADLDGLEWPARLAAVRGHECYRTASFVELAIALARDRFTRPATAEQWARLAIEASAPATALRAAELQPLAWAVLGNARRRRGDLRGAAAAFEGCRSTRHLAADPLDLAETLSLEASYWHQVRELRLAATLLEAAIEEATPYAGAEVIARYRIKAGGVATDAERWEEALELLLAGLDALDVQRAPGLALAAGHNVVAAAIGLGLVEFASRTLSRLRSTYRRHAPAKLSLQRDWLLARLAAAWGNAGAALDLLEEVRDGYLREDLPYDAAVAELEIAATAAELGADWGEVERAAAAASRILLAAGSPQEALAGAALVDLAVQGRGERAVVAQLARHAVRMVRVVGARL
jgi:hypothetical protein